MYKWAEKRRFRIERSIYHGPQIVWLLDGGVFKPEKIAFRYSQLFEGPSLEARRDARSAARTRPPTSKGVIRITP